MEFNLSEFFLNCLKQHPEEKFDALQIAEWIFKTYPEACKKKAKGSKQENLNIIDQIRNEISSRTNSLKKKDTHVKTIEERPRKYYYSELSDSEEITEKEKQQVVCTGKKDYQKNNEHTLYPLLAQYLWAEFGIYSKRIDEKRSTNKRGLNGNLWLYPDMVSMENLTTDWDREVRDCVKEYCDKQTKLWSFEVKRILNRSNVRECFFQAVSNSTWANFGYLVAAEIGGQDTLQELRMLSSAQGIGCILLKEENPSESQILIPSRERNEIDWDMANRLATENRDFLSFVKNIRKFYQTGDVSMNDWDAVCE